MTKQRILIILTLVALGTVLTAPFLGVTPTPVSAVLSGSALETKLFWGLRVPRVLMSFLVGGGLAIGGLIFQATFRNFLATPFTLGVSSGAAFGASIYYIFGFSFGILLIPGSALFALVGALITVVLIVSLSSVSGHGTAVGMLLCGVVVSFFFSSLIVFFQYVSDYAGIVRTTRWLMGSVETVGFIQVMILIPFVGLGLLSTYILSPELDLLILGDDLAISRGLSPDRVRYILFIVASIMIAGIVSFCGPIGFVDLIVAHIGRLLIGSRHRALSIFCFVFGGAFLTMCDTFSRIIIAPFEIPVGVITALLGGPFFLWLLIIRGRRLQFG